MKRIFVLLALVLLAGCVPVPAPRPVPLPFMSPVARIAVSPMQHLPYIVAVPNKLGIPGGSGAQAQTLGASWLYFWSPRCDGSDSVECVPMIRDASTVGQPVSAGAWLLGFNEPDLCPAQACLTPAEAARLWREMELIYRDKRLVAPAPSHEHPEWIVAFYAAYVTAYGQAPRLDALAFHCYLPWAADCIELGERYVALAELWGVPEVWATEFAFVPAYSWHAEGQASQFVTWLEQEERVTRYAPFMSRIDKCDQFWPDCRPSADPSLFTASGALTDIGTWYHKDIW